MNYKTECILILYVFRHLLLKCPAYYVTRYKIIFCSKRTTFLPTSINIKEMA